MGTLLRPILVAIASSPAPPARLPLGSPPPQRGLGAERLRSRTTPPAAPIWFRSAAPVPAIIRRSLHSCPRAPDSRATSTGPPLRTPTGRSRATRGASGTERL